MSTSLRSLVEFKASPMYKDDMLVSSQKAVLERRQVELIPRESNVFGFQVNSAIGDGVVLNDKLTFLISDPRYYLNWKDSYLSGEFTCLANTAADATIGRGSFLDKGGIGALVKKITLRHGSQILHEIDNFNKLYNIFNLASYSDLKRDYVMGNALDSVDDYSSRQQKGEETELEFTAAGSSLAANGTLTAVGTSFLADVKIGDEIILEANDPAQGGRFVVSVVTSNTVLRLRSVAATAVITAGNITRIAVVGRVSTRSRVVQQGAAYVDNNNTRHRFKWMIPLGMFSKDKYFPLPFMTQPLELIFEFVEPSLGLVVPDAPDATTKLGYKITRPRFVASMVEPGVLTDNDMVSIGAAHSKMYDAEGIVYHFIDYRDYQSNVSGTQQVLNETIKANLESALAVFSVVTDQQAGNSGSGNLQAVQQEYSQSNFYKYKLESYQYRSGAQHFPQWGLVRTDDVQSGQAWDQLMKALDMVGMKPAHAPSIKPWEWADEDSDKFIIAVPLAKEKGGYANGVNLSQNFLEMELNWKDTLPNNVTVHTYVAFDKVLRLSRRSILSYY